MAKPKLYPEGQKAYHLRFSEKTWRVVRLLAEHHGRSVNVELGAALDFYVVLAMIDACSDPGFVEGVKAAEPDFNPDEFRAMLEGDLEVVRDRAFNKPQALAEAALSK